MRAFILIILMTLSACVTTPEDKYTDAEEKALASDLYDQLNMEPTILRMITHNINKRVKERQSDSFNKYSLNEDQKNLMVVEIHQLMIDLVKPYMREKITLHFTQTMQAGTIKRSLSFFNTLAGQQFSRAMQASLREYAKAPAHNTSDKELVDKQVNALLKRKTRAWSKRTQQQIAEFSQSLTGKRFSKSLLTLDSYLKNLDNTAFDHAFQLLLQERLDEKFHEQENNPEDLSS